MNSPLWIFVLLSAMAAPLLAAPPPNDDFASAQVIPPAIPVSLSGTLVEATAQAGEADYDTELETLSPLATVWYTWTPASSADIDLRTEGELDSILGVFTGSTLSTLVPVAINDQTSLGTGNTSRVTFSAVANTPYRIMVDAYTTDERKPFVVTLATVVRPPNDNYANAQTLSGLAVSITSSNLNASAETLETTQILGQPAAASVWWRWSHTSAGRVEMVATNNPSFTPRLALFTGTSLPGTRVAEGLGRIRYTYTANTTYRLSVDGLDGEEGEFDLVIRPAPSAPARDTFDTAATPTGLLTTRPVTLTATTVGASAQTREPLHATYYPWASIWFYYQSSAAARVEVDTIGSGFDTSLAVYTGTVLATLTPIVSNDDAGGTTQSRVRFNAAANVVYRIAVDSPTQEEGAVTLNIRTAPTAPANDAFASSSVLGPAIPTTFPGTTIGASSQQFEPLHDPTDFSASSAYSSTWHRWTAPSSGWVEALTTNSNFNTVLAVYTGTAVTNLESVVNNNDDGATTTSRVEFYARSGTIYRFAVDGVLGAEGTYQLALRTAPPVLPFHLDPTYYGEFDSLGFSFPARPMRYYELLGGASPGDITNLLDSTTAFDTNGFLITPSYDVRFFRARAADPP